MNMFICSVKMGCFIPFIEKKLCSKLCYTVYELFSINVFTRTGGPVAYFVCSSFGIDILFEKELRCTLGTAAIYCNVFDQIKFFQNSRNVSFRMVLYY